MKLPMETEAYDESHEDNLKGVALQKGLDRVIGENAEKQLQHAHHHGAAVRVTGHEREQQAAVRKADLGACRFPTDSADAKQKLLQDHAGMV